MMSTNKHLPMPSIEYLRECFILDVENGLIYWKDRPKNHFTREYQYKIWNSAYSGSLAMVDGGQGYFLTCINKKRYKSHRIIYFMHYGIDPGALLIDHLNSNRSDNRPENLRLATYSQNAVHFSGARSDSLHGIRGISFHKNINKWEARVHINGKGKYLGVFSNKKEAEMVANNARKELFGEYYEYTNAA